MNPGRLRFHDLVFDDDLLSAARDDGSTLRLTRQERALLGQFIARPNRLLRRDQLLTALSDDPGEVSDRNVDFIVNRLRRKLRDPARRPRFIATQYGEGYTWIAPPRSEEPPSRLLVIGPVRGASEAADAAAAERLLALLLTAFEARTAPGRVMVRPDWRPGLAGFRFSLEADFRVEDGALQAALTLREEPGRRVVSVTRIDAVATMDEAAAASSAATTIAAIWRHLTVSLGQNASPTDAPLLVQMHEAVMTLDPSDALWTRIAAQIEADRAAQPKDPYVALVWAMHLAALLQRRRAGDPADPATYERIESQIEGLVLASLPAIRHEPAFTITAAGLLVGVHRGHEAFAEGLVKAALAAAPTYAMALPVLGHIAAARGDLAGALANYEEALRLCEPGTEFEVFLLVLKTCALIAKGEREAAAAAFERIRAIKPIAGRQLELIFLAPGDESLTPGLRIALARMTPDAARAVLGYQYHVAARRFGEREQQRNIMAGLIDHLVRRFGDAVVPEAVRAALAG